MADKNVTLKDVNSNNLYPTTQVGNVLGLGDYVANYADKTLSNVSYPAITSGSTTTGSGDRVVEQYYSSDKKSWYRLWASGWKECGMFLSTGSSTTQTTYILPITFSDTYYTAVCSICGNSDGTNIAIQRMGLVSKTVSQVTAWGNNTNFTKYLYCAGY